MGWDSHTNRRLQHNHSKGFPSGPFQSARSTDSLAPEANSPGVRPVSPIRGEGGAAAYGADGPEIREGRAGRGARGQGGQRERIRHMAVAVKIVLGSHFGC